MGNSIKYIIRKLLAFTNIIIKEADKIGENCEAVCLNHVIFMQLRYKTVVIASL